MAPSRTRTRTVRGRPLLESRPGLILDSHGRPFATTLAPAYRGAGESRRSRAWGVTDASINALLGSDVADVRRRSRDVARKSAWAESAAESRTANAVGPGIVPRLLLEDDVLRREALEAWEEFVEECDADGTSDFYGLQSLVCRSEGEGGDVFVRLRPRRPSDGLSVPLQLQVLEAELCDPTFEEVRTAGGGRIQAGIEFDAIGRRVAYHLWRTHPGEFTTVRNLERVRVPADNVLHVYRVLRPGQIRGVPKLAVVLAKLWDLERYDDAELMRKQVAAMFAGFITQQDHSNDPLDTEGQEQDHDGALTARLEPGTLQELDPGQEITFAEPTDVGANYEPFMRWQLRQVSSGSGTTYEQLTGDLSEVNFSSIRAGLIEAGKRLAQYQRNCLIYQFCRPVWRRFVEQAVLSGRIALPQDPAVLRQLLRVQWTVPGREYVDPEKEVRATVAKIRGGITSRSKAVAELGIDAEQLDREIAADNARADRLGLVFESDGRKSAAMFGGGGGAPQPGPQREEEDEDEEIEDEEDDAA